MQKEDIINKIKTNIKEIQDKETLTPNLSNLVAELKDLEAAIQECMNKELMRKFDSEITDLSECIDKVTDNDYKEEDIRALYAASKNLLSNLGLIINDISDVENAIIMNRDGVMTDRVYKQLHIRMQVHAAMREKVHKEQEYAQEQVGNILDSMSKTGEITLAALDETKDVFTSLKHSFHLIPIAGQVMAFVNGVREAYSDYKKNAGEKTSKWSTGETAATVGLLIATGVLLAFPGAQVLGFAILALVTATISLNKMFRQLNEDKEKLGTLNTKAQEIAAEIRGIEHINKLNSQEINKIDKKIQRTPEGEAKDVLLQKREKLASTINKAKQKKEGLTAQYIETRAKRFELSREVYSPDANAIKFFDRGVGAILVLGLGIMLTPAAPLGLGLIIAASTAGIISSSIKAWRTWQENKENKIMKEQLQRIPLESQIEENPSDEMQDISTLSMQPSSEEVKTFSTKDIRNILDSAQEKTKVKTNILEFLQDVNTSKKEHEKILDKAKSYRNNPEHVSIEERIQQEAKLHDAYKNLEARCEQKIDEVKEQVDHETLDELKACKEKCREIRQESEAHQVKLGVKISPKPSGQEDDNEGEGEGHHFHN